MKKEKLLKTIILAALGAVLTACGPSEEKLSEAEEARSELVSARQIAEETFLDITDASNEEKLDELSKKAAEIEAMDFSKLNDKKLDELLPSINELTDEYRTIETDLAGVLNEETKEREEKAKHIKRDVYFINKTGMNLTGLLLHDKTMDAYSDNFIGSEAMLKNGYSLMGVTLDIYEDSSEWEFVATSDGGMEYFFTCGNLKELDESEVTIVLHYDADTKEGTAGIPTKEEIEEEEQEETDEITEEAAQEAAETPKEDN